MKWVFALVLLQATVLDKPYTIRHNPPLPDICMAWILSSESRGSNIYEQRAVYDVVRTRMWERELTSCEVLKQPFQFSGYRKGMKIVVSKEDLTRLENVRKIDPVVQGAEYFHASSVRPYWVNKMERVKKVGKSVFYKLKEKQ